jgi:hypothetical protein
MRKLFLVVVFIMTTSFSFASGNFDSNTLTMSEAESVEFLESLSKIEETTEMTFITESFINSAACVIEITIVQDGELLANLTINVTVNGGNQESQELACNIVSDFFYVLLGGMME